MDGNKEEKLKGLYEELSNILPKQNIPINISGNQLKRVSDAYYEKEMGEQMKSLEGVKINIFKGSSKFTATEQSNELNRNKSPKI